MYSITDDEIDFILGDIEKRGIVTEDVKYNILDHVCCIIEMELKDKKNFNKFYEDTIAQFYHKELREIEDETRDLVTFKYYYAMKRTVKITGLVSVILILFGSLFKAQHWPGAGVLLLGSLAVFGLIFIPLNIILKFRDDKSKQNRSIVALGLSQAMFMTIGILFKVMHWPGANILIISSLAIFTFVFIPIYFFSRYRNPETKFNAIIHSTFMIAAAGLLFSLINLKTSHNVTASVESMDLFQDSNLEQLKENNAALYAEISHDSSKELEKFQEITAQLLKRMRDIKANLIAQSNKIPIEKAENMTLADVQHPNDMRVIHEHFEEAKGELSYDGFKEAVQQYNDGISDFDAANVIRPVDIEELQMTHTMLSVVLNELVDIEIQVLANENSYLSLSKGLVAKN